MFAFARALCACLLLFAFMPDADAKRRGGGGKTSAQKARQLAAGAVGAGAAALAYRHSRGFGDAYITQLIALKPHPKLQLAGKPAKLGYMHSRFAVFGLPLGGSTDGDYVLYISQGSSWNFQALDQKQAATLYQYAGRTMPAGSPLSFLSLIWGWFIVGPLFVIFAIKKLRPEADVSLLGNIQKVGAKMSGDTNQRGAVSARSEAEMDAIIARNAAAARADTDGPMSGRAVARRSVLSGEAQPRGFGRRANA